jgi:hypothetical protein
MGAKRMLYDAVFYITHEKTKPNEVETRNYALQKCIRKIEKDIKFKEGRDIHIFDDDPRLTVRFEPRCTNGLGEVMPNTSGLYVAYEDRGCGTDKKEQTKLKNEIRRYRTAILHHICGNDYKTCQIREGCDEYKLCRAYHGAEDVEK